MQIILVWQNFEYYLDSNFNLVAKVVSKANYCIKEAVETFF
ncbi:hypothetical protein Cylst_3292 [Cylindrospermum stagnale PCC 7417]|uniref:Uncharacterized protein n=1 Tax=Cylindrospermum stagnale PCC 7417 TaxID=56107 RepID=K9WYJ4_9NOST|nr:hypothetical protein [Cylindrospermum stagnale]AFZ25445.1 hypothetical protein Cylst_3292 [Cylindrospermum stagnale PCC 7417]